MISKLTKLMSNEAIVSLVFVLLRRLAKNTKTTVDDQLINALALALKGKDYGLQRKATPAKTSGKTKKA